jgi:hypothetical protein
MSAYRETVYRGRDNEIVLALEQGGKLRDASGVTRCQLVFQRPGVADVKVDSQTNAAFFSFQEKSTVRGERIGVLVLKLGELDGGVVADGLYDVAVYLYDAQNDDGVYWDSIEMLVRDGDT